MEFEEELKRQLEHDHELARQKLLQQDLAEQKVELTLQKASARMEEMASKLNLTPNELRILIDAGRLDEYISALQKSDSIPNKKTTVKPSTAWGSDWQIAHQIMGNKK